MTENIENTGNNVLDQIYNESGAEQEQVKDQEVSQIMADNIDPTKLRQKNLNPRPFSPQITEKTIPLANQFLDDRALQTYYYLNVSEGKVVISDLGVAIQLGQPTDLLDIANEEDILKSKDVRRATRVHGTQQPLLKRLTPEEFERLYTRWSEREVKIAQIRTDKEAQLDEVQKDPQAFKVIKSSGEDSELKIRPQIQSMVEKLRLGTGNVNAQEAKTIARDKVAGMSSEEFLAKLDVMQLSPDEVEYVFQTVMQKDVRNSMVQKYGYQG